MLTYASYLHLEELLDLQNPLSNGPDGPAHDEELFILIHQAYELWFKALIHEFEALDAHFRNDDISRSLQSCRRIVAILKISIAQFDVLETITPLTFKAFRHLLGSASGFESAQFREIEFMLGQKCERILATYPEDGPEYRRLSMRYRASTIWDAFLHLLFLHHYPVPGSLRLRDVSKTVEPSPEIQAIVADAYRNEGMLGYVCEQLLEIDERLQEWRYRHKKAVERIIGARRGTGGSAGASYLVSTIKPCFPDLWILRSSL